METNDLFYFLKNRLWRHLLIWVGGGSLDLESYKFLMTPQGNKFIRSDDGWEIIGKNSILFTEVNNSLLAINGVTSYLPIDSWPGFDNKCYFEYQDGISIIEIEVNSGKYDPYIKEISIRFAVCNPLDTYEKAVELCRRLSDAFKLIILDLRLGEQINLYDDVIMLRSNEAFQEKYHKFFGLFGLKDGSISEPIHCGKVVMERLRKVRM